MSSCFGWPNHCTDFHEISHGYTFILEEGHRLLFAVIIHKGAGEAARECEQ